MTFRADYARCLSALMLIAAASDGSAGESSPAAQAESAPVRVELVSTLQKDGTIFHDFCVRPDGLLVLAGTRVPDAKSQDLLPSGGCLLVLEIPSLRLRYERNSPELPIAVGTSSDNKTLATAMLDVRESTGSIQLLSADLQGPIVRRIPWEPPIPQPRLHNVSARVPPGLTAEHLAFSDDRRELYAYGRGVARSVRCRIALEGNADLPIQWADFPYIPSRTAVDAVHGRVAGARYGIQIYDLSLDRELGVFRHVYSADEEKALFEVPPVESLSWSPDGRFLFSRTAAPLDIHVWDTLRQESVLRKLDFLGKNVNFCDWVGLGAIRSTGDVLAVVVNKPRFDSTAANFRPETKEIRLYDIQSQKQVENIAVSDGFVQKIQFAPKSDLLVVIVGQRGLEVFNSTKLTLDRCMHCAKSSRVLVYRVSRQK